MLDLLAGILATWRLTSLFARERGPRDVFLRLRSAAGIKHYRPEDFPAEQRGDLASYLSPGDPYDYPETFWAQLLKCTWCLSLWVAFPLALWLWQDWKERLVGWLALSGGAIVVEERLKEN